MKCDRCDVYTKVLMKTTGTCRKCRDEEISMAVDDFTDKESSIEHLIWIHN